MRVHLVFPPHWFPVSPYLALPTLAGALAEAGIDSVQHDLALHGFRWLLAQPLPETPIHGALALSLRLVEGRPAMLPTAAAATFRSPSFFDPERLRGAQSALDWWFLRLQGAWQDMVIDRYRYLAPSLDSDHPYRRFLTAWADALHPGREDMIAISLATEHQVISAVELGRALVSRYPSTRLALGGAWLAHAPIETVATVARSMGVHAVVVGDGTEAIVELARARDWGRSKVKRVVRPGTRFPCPIFDKEDLPQYLLPQPVLPMWNAKGCYYGRCTFCDEPASHGGASTGNPADTLADHVADVLARHPSASIELNAECDTPARLQRFAAALLARSLRVPWSARARIEPALCREDCLHALATSGCKMLVFGLETLSDAVLARMNKGYRSAVARDVLASVGEHGIWRSVFLLLGFPGDRLDGGLRTVAELDGPPRLADSVQCSVLRVPAGAPLAADASTAAPTEEASRSMTAPIRGRHPWAFRGATREALLLALRHRPHEEVRRRLDAVLR